MDPGLSPARRLRGSVSSASFPPSLELPQGKPLAQNGVRTTQRPVGPGTTARGDSGEGWPSGLRHTLGKRAYVKAYREFESHSLRHPTPRLRVAGHPRGGLTAEAVVSRSPLGRRETGAAWYAACQEELVNYPGRDCWSCRGSACSLNHARTLFCCCRPCRCSRGSGLCTRRGRPTRLSPPSSGGLL